MLTKEEIKRFIEDDKFDSRKRDARLCQRYYDGIHDIRDYKLYYYNAEGKLVEDETRSNIKISHPFYTELIDQAVQYLFNGSSRYLISDIPDVQKILDDEYNNNDDFNAEFSDVLTDSKSKGYGYLYAYMNKAGHVSFSCADTLGVIEVRAKETEDNCDYVIYHYLDHVGKNKQAIIKIEVWDKSECWFYVMDGQSGDIKLDESEKINPRPHILYEKKDELYYDDFGTIPFFRLDNNKKRVGDLHSVKDLIDDYDLMSCGLSNNLQDISEGIYVVSGFKGDNLDELIQNIKTKKTIGVDEGGGIDIKTINIPYEARKVKLQEDEKNIYRFGMGLNTALVGDGNVTNVVIKSRYALLDMRVNKFENKVKQFLKKLVELTLNKYNDEHETGYTVNDIRIEFERDIIANANDNAQLKLTEAQTRQSNINTLLSLYQLLGDETVIKEVCTVLDLNYEEVKSKLPQSETEIENLEDLNE